jgi:hypothetical protein
MPLEGFEPTIPVSARPRTYALDRAATGIDHLYSLPENINVLKLRRMRGRDAGGGGRGECGTYKEKI